MNSKETFIADFRDIERGIGNKLWSLISLTEWAVESGDVNDKMLINMFARCNKTKSHSLAISSIAAVQSVIQTSSAAATGTNRRFP